MLWTCKNKEDKSAIVVVWTGIRTHALAVTPSVHQKPLHQVANVHAGLLLLMTHN
jgi:hypothetical protein